MKNSCRNGRDDTGKIEFTVTQAHVALLKNLNMKVATFVEDEKEYDGYFQNYPGIDMKRPFGNSGDPAREALSTIGMKPAGPNGAYDEGQLSYGRYLILSLPMAYEAVMARGSVEPCVATIEKYGGAAFSFRHKRVLEFWRDAVNAACGIDGVSSHQLITLMMNTGAPDASPMAPLLEIQDMMAHCAWMRAALDAMKPYAANKYRSQHPDAANMPDDTIWDGLASGKYALVWDW